MSIQDGCEGPEYWDRLKRERIITLIVKWSVTIIVIGTLAWLCVKYWLPGLCFLFIGCAILGMTIDRIYNI